MASESSSNNAEITSIFSSSSGEHRWVIQMAKNFEIIDIDITPCISRVPETLRAEKSEAYAPKRTGLGPYHHFLPDLYDLMERKKLTIIKSAVKQDKNGKFPQTMINKLKKLEPKLRPCYDKLLDLDGETLAWIWAIDGLYLHQNLGKNFLEQDIFMLENQIPFLLLEEIEDHISQYKLSDKVVRDFCEVHSPLKWTQKQGHRHDKQHEPAHLLDCMYHLVVTDGHIRLKVGSKARMTGGGLESTATSILEELQKLADLIKQLHLDKICAPLFKKPNTALEIEIPFVSSLQKIGVKFAIAEGGISIEKLKNRVQKAKERKDEEENHTHSIYFACQLGLPTLPVTVSLQNTSKAIFLIIKIADIFNRITKSTDKQSELVGKVNRHYDSMLIVKVWRFVKKCLDSSWNFVQASRKVLCFFYSLILIAVLILQAFCDIYGCSKGQSQNFIFREAE
ncbi:unnamed protein product [Ilex paraguariensis]|uniref:Uncharacterized protein n=1 Tax=Ilex paraguariensis TaxID=185542 RepID=A0ABC8RUU3_9AQUA